MSEAENKVLILCQRKSGTDRAGGNVKDTIVPKLEQYVLTLVSSPTRIEYMSPGLLNEQNPDVDYKMALGKNSESDEFLSRHRGAYHVIVFQTCGIMFMKNTIPYVYDLLQKNGSVVFTTFTHNTECLIDLSLDKAPHNIDFITEFYRYFKPFTPTVNIKRDAVHSVGHIEPVSAAAAALGRRSRKRKSKKYRRRRRILTLYHGT